MATDADVQAAQDRVNALSEELATAQAVAAAAVHAADNDIRVGRLAAEEARLTAELANVSTPDAAPTSVTPPSAPKPPVGETGTKPAANDDSADGAKE